MKIGPISINWQGRRASPNNWEVSKNPRGDLEAYAFRYPEQLIGPGSQPRERLLHINYMEEIKAKKGFAVFAYTIAACWIANLLAITYLQGFGGRSDFVSELLGLRGVFRSFHLEIAEYVAFVTTTTATVLGLSIIVGKYLYKRMGAESGDYHVAFGDNEEKQREIGSARLTPDTLTAAGELPNMTATPPPIPSSNSQDTDTTT